MAILAVAALIATVLATAVAHGPDHAPVRLWDPVERGLLVGVAADYAATRVARVSKAAVDVEYHGFPACLALYQNNTFELCADADGEDVAARWTHPVAAAEADANATVALPTSVHRDAFKRAGIADLPEFWRLHRPADTRHVAALTRAQVAAVYLVRVLAALAKLDGRDLRVGTVLPVVPFETPHEPLHRALYAAAGVQVMRFVYREFAAIHTLALDQLGECLHANLTVLHAELTDDCFSATYLDVPLSDFIRTRSRAPRVCGPGALDAAKAWLGAKTDPLEKDDAVITDLVLAGSGWTPELRVQLLGTRAKSLPRVHTVDPRGPLLGAVTVLHQQHGVCTCGTRHPFHIRCDVVSHAETTRVFAATTDPKSPVAVPLTPDATSRVYALYDMWARHRGRATLLGTAAAQLHVHELGVDLDNTCAARVDPRRLDRRRTPKYRIFRGQAPPHWLVHGCLDTRAVQKLHAADDVVLNYYVQDKKWFQD